MTIRFCFFCGEGYNNKHGWLGQFECDQCKAVFEIPVTIKETQITLEEAEANFDQIPLTDKKAVRARRRRGI